MRAVRYAWALPPTLLGLTFALLAFGLGARPRLAAGALEVGGGLVGRCVGLLPRCCQFGAITLGHVIVGVDHPTLDRLRAHEHVHIRQYERWGALFFLLYLGSSLQQFVCGRDPYLNNAFEREAFARSPHDVQAARAIDDRGLPRNLRRVDTTSAWSPGRRGG